MSKMIFVKTSQSHYEIKFCDSYKNLIDFIKPLSINGKKVCIITDETVGSYYLNEVKEAIEPIAEKLIDFSIKPGEKSKNLNTVYNLYEILIQEHFDRESVLFALGGGVVGDLTGFVAATYLRGIDFVQLPTSLLAQVDSSIGGKTGVDFKGYKNMVGSFYQPQQVIINIKTLDTLDKEQFYAGMAEIIKHAIIKDKTFLDWLEAEKLNILSKDKNTLAEMIYKSCLIKKDIVEKDEKEQNIRALLNFGHTVGHAIEKIFDFKWLHGECVAVGMVVASYISFKRSLIGDKDFKRVEQIIKDYKLPIRISGLSPNKIIEVTKLDKKVKSSVLHFVLVEEVGKANIYTDVLEDELLEAINYIQ